MKIFCSPVHRNCIRVRQSYSARGLTRLEVVAMLAVLPVLLAVIFPALAVSRERSERLLCLANLREIAQGLQQWTTDHGGRLPWRTPWCEGGTTLPAVSSPCSGSPPLWFSSGLQNNDWFQFFWLSNELRSPKILMCPSDPQKRSAMTWDASPSGFLNASYRNAAVSYFVGLDAISEDKNGFLSGDRNVRFGRVGGGGGCSSGIRYNAYLEYTPNPDTISIDNQIHVDAGNFLFRDGSVKELSSRDLARRLRWESLGGDNGIVHYLTPD